MKDEATIITNNKDSYIYILHGQDNAVQDLYQEIITKQKNVILIDESFIRNKYYKQFSDHLRNADYLIVNESLDLYKLHKLNFAKIKDLVHGDGYYDRKGLLSSKKLIIISNHEYPLDIFKDDRALRMRCKFIY